jgi:hypothetical protein
MRAWDFYIESHCVIPIGLFRICVRPIDGLKSIYGAEGEPIWAVSHNASILIVEGYEV